MDIQYLVLEASYERIGKDVMAWPRSAQQPRTEANYVIKSSLCTHVGNCEVEA